MSHDIFECINEDVHECSDSNRALSSTVVKRISAYTADEYPDDFDMQKYTIEQQVEAYWWLYDLTPGTITKNDV